MIDRVSESHESGAARCYALHGRERYTHWVCRTEMTSIVGTPRQIQFALKIIF